ncbi:Z1 domain-containing protein [Mycolicibacterium smegmatis]|uniref:Z1 domain-containing protein n=1 Tax=Mycolicibacterium smegmatis TaxID=1772 RepID=UPI001E3A11C8|nr:Z1 domain-containing protein [Mycolicibacterium smegmatis]UGU30616.1 Z1 domain-containing protein [Mycolicibacterium smegmatis]ULN71533.1 Z1 domain-containing protein [Mycolicibacterium smegmatis]
MTAEWLPSSMLSVLKVIGNGPPKNIVARMQPDAEDHGTQIDAADITALINEAPSSDPVLTTLGMVVHKWDAEPATAEWTAGTLPSTPSRRELICKRLGLDEAGAATLLAKRPLYVDPTVVITAPWERWYTPDRANSHSFYWPHYMDYLLKVRKWPEESVTSLDLATTRVVERLADPTRKEAHQAKGLVVGYVQSGKTANFTGVIAKAIDAGYRLVIVMTGTIEMLRGQTQRRIDMEMVGKRNIVGDLSSAEALAANIDYQDDPDWSNKFQDFGGEPIATGINRLTRHKRDYQDQFMNLKFDRFDPSRPLYDPTNLFPNAARLVVTKKNATVLAKLVSNVKANKKAFAEVPVLIIDDESDQASVNTVNPERIETEESTTTRKAAPTKASRSVVNAVASPTGGPASAGAGKKVKDSEEEEAVKERRAINRHIATLLKLMPRAQYVGYTATPFANVFVDPSDPEDIYPKDFLISLPRPEGYMGVEDFHDLEPVEPPVTPANSNFDAYVRDLLASDRPEDAAERRAELGRAIDMFVLTGACKLYRAAQPGVPEFRHHTMLVHESVQKGSQKQLAKIVRSVWSEGGFTTPGGMKRLRALYVDDVLRVSRARLEEAMPPLPEFDVLKPYIAKTVSRITEHNNNPVLVVNSDAEIQNQQQQLDFDRNSTWRILVGGAKLSRGFTVEGLTVTYFRRTVRMSDSLTQMGRWFGFRHGYRDLVRLYIDRNAKFTARQRVDLYKAFEAIALDEAAFRAQLAQYAVWDGDKPRVRPSQIPPLVSQHLPWLKPTARNKMFNAVLDEQVTRVVSPSGYPFKLSHQRANLDLWRPVLSECSNPTPFSAGGRGNLSALSGVIQAGRFVQTVSEMKWMYEYKGYWVEPRLKYVERLISDRLLDDVLVVLPQPGTKSETIAGVGARRIINRDRRDRGGELIQKFGEITDPKHRDFIAPLLSPDRPKVHPLEDYWSATRGVALVYLVKEQRPQFDSAASVTPSEGASPERGLIVAFTLYLPNNAVTDDDVPKFRAVIPEDEEAPTVSVAK